MSSWIDKAKDFIKGNPEQAKGAVEKVEDLLNERTGGTYAEQLDQGSDALGEQLGLPPDPEDVAAPTPVPPKDPAPTEAPAPTGHPQGDLTPDDPPSTPGS